MDVWQETLDKIDSDFDNYILIEKMSSSEAFRLMASFIENRVSDPKMEGRLEQALEGHKPFANFTHALLHDMDVRMQWFDYKAKRYMDYVARYIELK